MRVGLRTGRAMLKIIDVQRRCALVHRLDAGVFRLAPSLSFESRRSAMLEMTEDERLNKVEVVRRSPRTRAVVGGRSKP